MPALFRKIELGTEPDAKRYPALTGVRAVGASVVFFDHLPLQAGEHVVIKVLAFFFALSGFLIVRLYCEQAELSFKWLSKFFVNRFARIYPVYFLRLTLAVLLSHETRPLFAFFEELVNVFIRRRFRSNGKSVGMGQTLFRTPE